MGLSTNLIRSEIGKAFRRVFGVPKEVQFTLETQAKLLVSESNIRGGNKRGRLQLYGIPHLLKFVSFKFLYKTKDRPDDKDNLLQHVSHRRNNLRRDGDQEEQGRRNRLS